MSYKDQHQTTGDSASTSKQETPLDAVGQDGSSGEQHALGGISVCQQTGAQNTNNSGEKAGKATAPASPASGISDRKRQSNRSNAQKSTGPRSARGKGIARFNALRHGLLAKRIMFSSDGKLLDEGLQRLLEDLRENYGAGDPVSELLLEATVVDYWRNVKALEYEMKYLSPRGCEFHPQGGMPGLQRYLTANRNALRKDLELLEQRQTSPAGAAEAETADDRLADSEIEDPEEADAA